MFSFCEKEPWRGPRCQRPDQPQHPQPKPQIQAQSLNPNKPEPTCSLTYIGKHLKMGLLEGPGKLSSLNPDKALHRRSLGIHSPPWHCVECLLGTATLCGLRISLHLRSLGLRVIGFKVAGFGCYLAFSGLPGFWAAFHF